MAPAPSFTQIKARYSRFWADMKIDQGRVAVLDSIARARIANKARYQGVEATTGVPWWWIAIIHNRESSGNFAGVLHNGEHIIGTGRKTRLVPAGRGPFNTWEAAADDALRLKGLQNIRDWSIEQACYQGERFNGWGYYWKGVPSAYLWSFSNIYLGGKYVADGVWSSTARDQQAGIVPLLRRMQLQDPTITFGVTAPPPPRRVTPQAGTAGGIAAGGAAVAAEAARQGAEPTTVIGILVAAAIIAVAAYFIISKIRNK